ncbi:MAG: Permease of the drug/metabolite transporter superfamily [Rhodospirillales bacterium]|jgi:drug/metabolite transporter (DMT)-like permease|nr:Permease of the drug/metabolite transporter superfamily [Rhodospirillales bacterium]
MRALSVPTGAEAMRGIWMVVAGYLVITLADAAVKWVLPEIGAAAAMICRGVIGGAVLLMITRGRGIFPRDRWLLTRRSLAHCLVSGSWYWAWANGMPLGDSYAVACASPLLMTLLAIPMLGEKVGWRRMTSTCVGFVGVLIMLNPGGGMWRIETAVLLVSTCIMAVTRIWTRVLSRTDTPAAIAFWLMAAHIPMGLLLLPAFPPPSGMPGLGIIAALLIFGAANAVAHLLFSRAFALAPVSTLAPYDYTPFLYGIGVGFLIWSEIPAWSTLAGATLVIAAGVYNLHRERVRRAAERA